MYSNNAFLSVLYDLTCHSQNISTLLKSGVYLCLHQWHQIPVKRGVILHLIPEIGGGDAALFLKGKNASTINSPLMSVQSKFLHWNRSSREVADKLRLWASSRFYCIFLRVWLIFANFGYWCYQNSWGNYFAVCPHQKDSWDRRGWISDWTSSKNLQTIQMHLPKFARCNILISGSQCFALSPRLLVTSHSFWSSPLQGPKKWFATKEGPRQEQAIFRALYCEMYRIRKNGLYVV